MSFLAIIADDFSGCTDAEIQLFPFSFRTVSLLPHAPVGPFLEESDVTIIDSEARLADAEDAYRTTFALAQQLCQAGVPQTFKKVDSTFRGNIGPELSGAMDALGVDFCALVPAYPANGRTTRNGIHLVHGKPISETEFSNDPVHPILCSRLRTLLQDQTEREVGEVALEAVRSGPAALSEALDQAQTAGVQIAICDAETDRDLEVIAAALHRSDRLRFFSGSAAMPGAALRVMGLRGDAESETRPLDAPALVINGSLNPLSAIQLQHLVSSRPIGLIGVDVSRILDETTKRHETERVVRAARGALEQSRLAVVTTHQKRVSATAPELLTDALPSQIGEMVRRLVDEHSVRNLCIIGGWTSLAIARALGFYGVSAIQEVEPGIALCRSLGGAHELRIVIKPGGFGSEAAVTHGVDLMVGGEPRQSACSARTAHR